ncbi:splicing factor U2af small subunit B-like isoform X1 [Mangifera indica]|uniref:splicing factor U2af small subunit B-like isoform X1 n=1 Tax=Mangifera indica TaxID=29780 RepID=UPI001CFB0EB7|nr:splicing factor U2af small subunit B-like isoform X1 [Mangifera indica]XP_044481245.1 splicing factor U2af small subunit B-like isoform X1 [Mangifera indica]XP_044481253.1 splicing factor U2af small subunit B-like isoform X1 [Mangifera indica]
MAEHLASIFGTEKDRVNCPFYFKIGACRHGDRCSRLHTKPSISPTLLLSNMYQRPDMITPGVDPQGQALDPRKIQDHFEDFYEDLFEELSKYGEIESLNICDNLADHMVGNVYVQFREEEHAANALRNLNGRFYAVSKLYLCKFGHVFDIEVCILSGRPIIVDFSPVTDFREATCRQYEENVCNRGGYCNFMHLKKISKDLRRRLFGRNRRRRSHSRSRSRSPHKHRGYEERSHGGRGSSRRDDERDHRYHDRGRRPRSRSPGRKVGRSRSPGSRRNRSPVRESSAERRAKIEQWNREKEEAESGHKIDNSNNDNDRNNNGFAHDDDQYSDPQQQ